MSLPRGCANRISGDFSKWVPHLIALRSPAVSSHWRNARRTWVCSGCRVQREPINTRFASRAFDHSAAWRRQFSTTHCLRDDNAAHPTRPVTPGTRVVPSSAEVGTATPAPTSSSSTTTSALPSHTEEQRSAASKRMSRLMDGLLARASIASQHINAYTGTDYSGIESLRGEIKAQEDKVRACHAAVDAAKATHHEAVVEQASAQREIVGLLERKSSWSPGDLERYMSLVRSEHVNDQAVQTAKESLHAAERQLEEARGLLERLERKQYHEEQVWSDTIRRNSTWVTFGLMGVNILLLLAQIAIFEPYRRKKIVRDVKAALDEKTVTSALTDVAHLDREPVPTAPQDANEPSPGSSERIDALVPTTGDITDPPASAGQLLPGDVSEFVGAIPSPDPPSAPEISLLGLLSSWKLSGEFIRDLFSERLVQVRRVDVTGMALCGVATGAAFTGLLLVLLGSR